MDKRLINHSGITLIELLMALVVMFLLLTIALPSFLESFNRQKVTGIGDNLNSLLLFAKAESATQGQRVWLRLQVDNTNPTQWRVALTEQASCDFTSDSPCLIDDIKREFNSEQYPGVSMITNMTSISVDPLRGRGTAGSTTFSISNSDVQFRRTQFGSHKICTSFQSMLSRYPLCN